MIKFLSYLVDFMIVVVLASSPIGCYISIITSDWFDAGLMGLCFVHGLCSLSEGWRSNTYGD
jgi:hypothetical protein